MQLVVKTKPVYIFLFILFCIPSTHSAQQLRYKFKQFTTNDGLPSSEVHQVLSDSRNFLWFATDHGVCRYDGNKFETFNLSDNSILSMYEDVKNRIWFVSFSGRLFYYEQGKFNSYRYNDVVIKNVNHLAISRVYVDSADNVYINSIEPNSFFINASGIPTQLLKETKHCILEAFEISDGEYFAYTSSYPRLSQRSNIFIPDAFFLAKIKSGDKEYTVKQDKFSGPTVKYGAKKLSDKSIVFHNNVYLYKVFQDGSFTTREFESYVLDVEELDDGNLLVATLYDGLYVLDTNDKEVANYLPKLTVSDIETDYEGGIWFSTTQKGVFYLSSLQMKHLSEKQVVLDKNIQCLELANDSCLWAGEDASIVYYLQPDKSLQTYSFPFLSTRSITASQATDTVLFCVGDLVTVPPMKISVYPNEKATIIVIQGNSDLIRVNGSFFTGTSIGVSKLNLKRRVLEDLNTEKFRVSQLFLDSKGDMLIGNLSGLWRFFDGRLQPYDSSKPLLKNRITAINELQKKYLCLGTRGQGLLMVVDNELHQLTEANGLSSNNIRKIFIDGNTIWLATNRGISRLSIQSLKPLTYTIRNISFQDGLLSNEVNDIKRLGNDIIVATNSGITFFNKELFSGNLPLPLSIYLAGARINGLDTVINQHYKLNHTHRNLVLTFAALSYRQSSSIELRYKMSEDDTTWIYMTGREIQFNPVPFGRHTVIVQARRRGENWSVQNSISLTIHCDPPFWNTTWFWVLAFFLTAFLIFLFFARRTRLIKQREKEKTLLNKRVADMEMKALRAQMNPHFIFNVLNSIQYFITHEDTDNAQYYMSKFAKLVRQTLDNSRSTFITLADELSLLRLYIDLEKIRFEDRFDYAIRVEDNIAVNAIKIPNMLLQPYVENSIKHGFRGKQENYFLDISISMDKGNIICVIEDNGIGREQAALVSSPEKQGHSSTGTAIINEKIEAMKYYYKYDLSSKTTDLKDKDGKTIGTRVTLVFPEKFDIQ